MKSNQTKAVSTSTRPLPESDQGDEIGPSSGDGALSFVEKAAVERAGRIVAKSSPTPRKKSKHERDAEIFLAVDTEVHPVDGVQTLDGIARLLRRYMILPKYASETLALWVFHTYLFYAQDFTPYIHVTSPTRECGKSTLLELLKHLAHRAMMTSAISPGALYRRIDRLQPTLVIDEMDVNLTRGERGDALRGVLNSGYHVSGRSTVCTGDGHDDVDYKTFGPKVFGGIGSLPSTTQSRSIAISLQRGDPAELRALRKVRGDRIDGICYPYRCRSLRWAKDHFDEVRAADPQVPDSLGARQGDIWRPLLAIADLAGGRWPTLAREAAVYLHSKHADEGDMGLLLLEDLKALIPESSTFIPTERLLEDLRKLEERPWPEYRRGEPINARGLSMLLKRFDVHSVRDRVGGAMCRGYPAAELSRVIAKYLPEKARELTENDAEMTRHTTRHTQASHSNSAPTLGLGGSVTDVTLVTHSGVRRHGEAA